MVFPGEPEYKRCESFIREVERRALPLTSDLPLVDSNLSRAWERFVDPEVRLRTLGPFLDSVLDRFSDVAASDLNILDAACGIGVETVYLLGKGYRVTANEIEETLRDKARDYAREKCHPIPQGSLSAENWLNFGKHFGANSFDVVMAIGNSVCLLDSVTEVEAAIDNFYSVLEPGGVLIVDERNFAYIERNWHELVDPPHDPWLTSRFNATRQIMYCGSAVRGAPVSRQPDENRIVFAYAQFEGDVRTETLGELSMYAFREGELRDLLCKRFGVSNVEMVYVIAQDVNQAQPDVSSEQAAQIIGGMVLTHQLTIDFQGGTCPLVPDGDLHVI